MTEPPADPTSAPSAGPRPCPTCSKPSLPRWRPFCSKHCADVDLGRWFGEVYRIPGPIADVDEDEDKAAAADDADAPHE